MQKTFNYIRKHVGIGLVVIVPVYLGFLLTLKALSSLGGLLDPVLTIMPDWLQSKTLLALLVLFLIIFVLGVLVETRLGQYIRNKADRLLFRRIPGYSVLRSLTERFAGESTNTNWEPALVETDDEALMPVFIIEELPDGRYTVFVPSVPTPFAGAVFVYQRERVHPIDIPFSHALRIFSHWGEGTKEFVAALEQYDSKEL